MSSGSGLPWAAAADGIALTVRLTPKGGRDAVDGIECLADGRAFSRCGCGRRRARVRPTARCSGCWHAVLGVPSRDVVLLSGETSRIKRLLIRGDASALAVSLAQYFAHPTRNRFVAGLQRRPRSNHVVTATGPPCAPRARQWCARGACYRAGQGPDAVALRTLRARAGLRLPSVGDFVEGLVAEFLAGAGDRTTAQRAIELNG